MSENTEPYLFWISLSQLAEGAGVSLDPDRPRTEPDPRALRWAAETAGVDEAQVLRWCSGEAKPTDEQWAAICRAGGVEVVDDA